MAEPAPSDSGKQIAKALGADVLPIRSPPATIARVDRNERWNTGRRWGDLRASELAAVMFEAEKGNVADWSDLCNFMLRDDLIGSLHQSRVLRVTQADWVISANKWGDQRLAKLAAELVNELMGRILDWPRTQKRLLHAIAAGFAAGQMVWEYDRQGRKYYVREIEFVHNHRFRYDEQWQLRLYDRGQAVSPASMYGQALDPDLWIVHQHQPRADYPGTAGQLMEVAWLWMFRRWVDKFHVGGVERAGLPVTYAKVPANTPQTTRDQIQSDLESLANGSAGVVNEDVTIEALDAAAATRSWEAYTTYLESNKERIVTSYMGASDVVSPGANGSQAAVNTRTSSMVDPRMVDDGTSLCATLQSSLFRLMVRWNAHVIGAPFEQIPLPEMRMKTADDEVKRDPSDLLAEMVAGGASGNVGPDGKPVPGVMPPQLQAHAQAAANAAKQAAGDGDDPDPKALARSSQRAGSGRSRRAASTTSRTTTSTRSPATSVRSLSPLERALSGELVE